MSAKPQKKAAKKAAKIKNEIIENSDESEEILQDDFDWNDDIIEDISSKPEKDLIVYSRDWTISTIIDQIDKNNIDLNPKFQRRNAWNDIRRSKLIESLVAGLPIPEIVLAEDPKKRKAFLVIDGKQRLLTIAGFVDPSIGYWNQPKLTKLTLRDDLNGKSYEQLKTNSSLEEEFREFTNADIRCTIISNFKKDDALYDIFHRLNSGSVPLSTQELRQVLHKGPLADYLIEITNTTQPIHKVLGLNGPDSRLKDVEIILRLIAIFLHGNEYKGNLKKFLDDFMGKATKSWQIYMPKVKSCYANINKSINNLSLTLDSKYIGRKYVDGKWERRFNKALFEVESYYFSQIPPEKIQAGKKEFIKGFQQLFQDSDFRASVEATTKTNERYELRFRKMRDLVNKSFGTRITTIPVK